MFVLSKFLTWEFTIETPGEDGKFTLTIRRPTMLEKQQAATEEKSLNYMFHTSVVGWSGLVDDNGTPPEFNETNLHELLGVPEIYNDLAKRLGELWFGRQLTSADSKN